MKITIIYHSETGNTKKMAELIKQGVEGVEGVGQVRMMPIEETDNQFLRESKVVILGSPTYEGSCSWQMKRFLDSPGVDLAGKLGGVFVSQNWPGGGGGSFAEMTMIAGMLVRGMLVFAGGISLGHPYLHFGAVSTRAPEDLYAERCVKLGQNLARKGVEIFGK